MQLLYVDFRCHIYLTACNNIRVGGRMKIYLRRFRNWSYHQKLCYTLLTPSSLLPPLHLRASSPAWKVRWPRRALFPQRAPFSHFLSPLTLILLPLSPFFCPAWLVGRLGGGGGQTGTFCDATASPESWTWIHCLEKSIFKSPCTQKPGHNRIAGIDTQSDET